MGAFITIHKNTPKITNFSFSPSGSNNKGLHYSATECLVEPYDSSELQHKNKIPSI